MAGFKMDDYVDVAERIASFYDRFPDGRLVTGSRPHVVEINGKPYIWYHARAYRTPDDLFPGDGWAAEPVPGPTQFTKDSELMNAETAAWGRAIVALGFSTKKIASRQEVQNRQGSAERAASPRPASHTGEVSRGAAAPEPSTPQAAPSPVASPYDAAAWWDRHSLADLNKAIAKMTADQAREGLILEGNRQMRGKGAPRKTVLTALSDRIRNLEGLDDEDGGAGVPAVPKDSGGGPQAVPAVSQATTEPAAAGSDSEPAPSPVLLVKAALAWIADQPSSVDNAPAWTEAGVCLGLSEPHIPDAHRGTFATLEEVPVETLDWIWDSAIPDPVRQGVGLLGPEALAKMAAEAK